MGDEIVRQVYRFDGECPVCRDRFKGFKSDEDAVQAAAKCYFKHDETPDPSEEQAEWVGLTGTLACAELLDGCGWEGDRRTAPYSALEFSKCPDCGEHGLVDGDFDE